MRERIDFYKVQWRDIVLLIMHHVEEDDFGDVAISVRSIKPFLAPLPDVEGGTFGYGCKPATIEAAGGPVACILAWMDKKTEETGWQPAPVSPKTRWWNDDAYEEEQYALFDDLPLIVVESEAQNGSA